MRPALKVVSSAGSSAEPQQTSEKTHIVEGASLSIRFRRVPTHTVGVASERRSCARAFLRLPMRLTRVEGAVMGQPVTLVTRDISSSGIYFLAPRRIEPGTAIEIEVALIERPMGQGTVRMSTAAHVIRTEESQSPGWHGLAARFDNFEFSRDEALPPRFGRR